MARALNGRALFPWAKVCSRSRVPFTSGTFSTGHLHERTYSHQQQYGHDKDA